MEKQTTSTVRCACRPVRDGMNLNQVTGMDPTGCPVHGLTLAELEQRLIEAGELSKDPDGMACGGMGE